MAPSLRLLAALLVCLSARVSRAAETFADDFELNALGRWPQQVAQPSVTLRPDAAARHRGQLGLRVSDESAGSGTGPQGFVGLVPTGASAQYYFRFWLRLQPERAPGEIVVCEIESVPETSVSSVLDLRFKLPEGEVSLAGYDGAGTYEQDGAVPFAIGSWHLIEGAMLGLNTNAGERRLWIDGVRAASGANRAFSGVSLGQLKLGEPYADERAFRGDLDLDDFRAGSTPPASRLVLTVPASATEGACVPVSLSLLDSEGAPAPAPYDVEASVSAAVGQAELFADEACATPRPRAVISAAQLSTTLHVRPTQTGTLTLMAAHLDFLPDQKSAQILEAAEAPNENAPVQPLRGWSCEASLREGLGSAWVLLGLLGARRRRRAP